jgi:hypothetical protein
MEPKDLKNSEELKSMEISETENSDNNTAAKKVKKAKVAKPAVDENPALGEENGTSVSGDAVVEVVHDEPDEVVQEEKQAEDTTVVLSEKEEPNEPEVIPLAEVAEPEISGAVVEQTGENEAITAEPDVIPAAETETTEIAVDEPGEDKEVAETVPVSEPEIAAEPLQAEKTEPSEKSIAEVPVLLKAVVGSEEETKDYSSYSQIELVNAMRDLLENQDEYDIKDEIDAIKAVFYKNLNGNIEEQKKQFLDDGGNEEEFVPEEDPYENDIKDLLKEYRNVRIEFNKKLEAEKEENLKLKYAVIEEIKALINNEESINKTFQEFRDLQRRWREIGLVPQSKMKNLWDTYHFHVENFYDYIKINKELRDLDLKKNLEAKIELCEKAEELLVESSVLKAFNSLQKFHEQWREIAGPLENKEDIWERFKAATAKINKNYQDFFETRKTEQKKNFDAKTALCEKVEEIIELDLTSNKEWDDKSKELVQLQKIWRTIGFAPRKDNNKIYERFRTACDNFFDKKREFYSKNKEIQQNNLQLKLDLCLEAETLKDSTDWKKTTQDFINIQKRWKEIGPVSRKHSEIIWKRFRAACDYFFEKKSEHFSGIDTEQVDNLALKEQLIEEVIQFQPSDDVNENLKTLKSFQRRWTEIGHVPIKKKDDIQIRFRDAINKLYDELNLDEEKRNLLNFRSKMNSYSESNRGQSKMRMEREKYMNKLKQLENDLVLLDNNIGFFAKSKNAESLIEDVKKKIENSREKIDMLKEHFMVIDDIDK